MCFRDDIYLVDDWEIDSAGILSTLEDQIGEGAFGKVYKATLNELPAPVKNQSFHLYYKTGRKKNLSDQNGVAVAVKTLKRKRTFLI